jgi:hypothetical protein
VSFGKQFLTCEQYFSAWYEPTNRIAVFVKNYGTGQTLQRIATSKEAVTPGFQAWIQSLNQNGGNVYSSVNVFRTVAGGRTKGNIARILGVHMEIDHDGETAVHRLLADPRVPSPSILINSSPGRYQLLWKAYDLTVEQAESVNKALTYEFGGDTAATDATRVLRLPGFHNWKYESPFTVTAQYLSERVHSPADFQLNLTPAAVPGRPALARRSYANERRKITQSERDWAMVMERLSGGESRDVIQRDLELSRPDKPRPAFYAQLTLDKAVRELQLRSVVGSAPEIER